MKENENQASPVAPAPVLLIEGAALIERSIKSLSKKGPARQELLRWLGKVASWKKSVANTE